MKRIITDDSQVKDLCQRLGVWPAVAAQQKAGSGVLLAGGWVVAYYPDGLAAVEASNTADAAFLMASLLTAAGKAPQ